MAKITRVTAKLFGVSAGATGVEEFASKAQGGALVYSTDPADLQTAFWTLGWTAAQFDGTFAPYFQDRNAVDLVTFYQLAYLLQAGVAEWDAATTYYARSVVLSSGAVYLSLADNNLNNIPPASASNAFWRRCAFPSTNQAKSPTRTVLLSGSGTYTPPAGCLRVFARLVGSGGGGGGIGGAATAGTATTLGALSAGGGGPGAPPNGFTTAIGGTGGVASGGDVNVNGGVGADTPVGVDGRAGGSSKFGGAAGTTRFHNQISYDAAANSGSGGGGASIYVPASGPFVSQGGAGGGAGGYLEKAIYTPSAMAYVVGVGGLGAPAGGGTPPVLRGGNGADGMIILDEYYY